MKINLKRLLKQRRITQKQLAIDTDISPMLINKMCNQSVKRLPTDALDSICEYLDVSIEELLEVEKRA